MVLNIMESPFWLSTLMDNSEWQVLWRRLPIKR